MPKATVRANARTLPEATNRRAVLGAVLAAGAIAAIPGGDRRRTLPVIATALQIPQSYARHLFRAEFQVYLAHVWNHSLTIERRRSAVPTARAAFSSPCRMA